MMFSSDVVNTECDTKFKSPWIRMTANLNVTTVLQVYLVIGYCEGILLHLHAPIHKVLSLRD